MISAVQIQSLSLPPRFIFDSLKLYAKFVSATVDLFALKFSVTSFQKERTMNLNVQVKIPASRSRFVLALQVIIINMHIPSVEIPIDLDAIGDWNQYQLLFQTEMGPVSLNVNLIQEIYLPKQDNKITNRKWTFEHPSNKHEDSIQSEESLVQNYNILRSNEAVIGNQGRREFDKEKQILKKNYSSKRKIGHKPQKMNLSRSEYMKLDIDESILECDQGNAETESDLKYKNASIS